MDAAGFVRLDMGAGYVLVGLVMGCGCGEDGGSW